ncbi:MAG: lysine--tRNA ligase [Planctomycetes bacterium]|nr:lysine--tRNA ligase [Planctomycetota bacterium]
MLEKVQDDRQKKFDAIRELGIDPYGVRFDDVEPIAFIRDRYEEIPEGGEPTQRARSAGRLVLKRDMGKMTFATIRDSSGQMQIAIRKNAVNETQWQLNKLLDLGDIVGVQGPLQRTRTGEITIWVDELTLLCKSLLPMPEKFHGLQDVQTRYRQRYLDLMTNPESLNRFKQRVAIIEHFRSTLNAKGFLEVETPMMQAIYGGAAARPFTTHHNTLDVDLFLRISPELYLKRLLVGGFERVFEINRNFRNEGIDTSHNPEFTMMELYQAYSDYHGMMDITEELIGGAAELQRDARQFYLTCYEAYELGTHEQFIEAKAKAIGEFRGEQAAQAFLAMQPADLGDARDSPETRACWFSADEKTGMLIAKGKIALRYGDHALDFTRPWRRAKYADLLAEHAGVDMKDIAAVRAKARELGIEEGKLADAVVVNEVFEATVEEHLIQPTFVYDYPAELCPLTRRKADDPSIAERFELYIAGMEIANAYTELNDPKIQAENLAAQVKGEEGETMRVMDEDFVTSLMHGMPPAGGLGIGIDRVIMLLTNTPSIRDVVLFPMLRPEATTHADEPNEEIW